MPDANAVTLGDYVTDTKSWITAIRQRISEIHVALGAQENLRAELARLEAALAALES